LTFYRLIQSTLKYLCAFPGVIVPIQTDCYSNLFKALIIVGITLYTMLTIVQITAPEWCESTYCVYLFFVCFC